MATLADSCPPCPHGYRAAAHCPACQQRDKRFADQERDLEDRLRNAAYNLPLLGNLDSLVEIAVALAAARAERDAAKRQN